MLTSLILPILYVFFQTKYLLFFPSRSKLAFFLVETITNKKCSACSVATKIRRYQTIFFLKSHDGCAGFLLSLTKPAKEPLICQLHCKLSPSAFSGSLVFQFPARSFHGNSPMVYCTLMLMKSYQRCKFNFSTYVKSSFFVYFLDCLDPISVSIAPQAGELEQIRLDWMALIPDPGSKETRKVMALR